jgi:hypothetical protein
MISPATRAGRRFKPVPPTDPAKISLGLRVTADVKQFIDGMAIQTGRTQSQQVLFMVERCLQYDGVLASLRATLETIERDGVESTLYRLGWRPLRMPGADYKTVWSPP